MVNNSKRYCSVKSSLIESCKEVKLMIDGKKEKVSWRDHKKDIIKMKEDIKNDI